MPRGFANFLLSTVYALEGLVEDDQGKLGCAVMTFQRAAGQVVRWHHPELYAAVFNNAAVAQLALTDDMALISEARAWLWKAANIVDEKNMPVVSARSAFLNFIRLEREIDLH